MINHRFPVPLIPVTGKVLNGTNGPVLYGDLVDLAGSISVGLYDADTNAIATTSGNGKVFYVGYSSEHTKDFLDKWFFGMQLPKGSPSWKFKGADVISFEYSNPAKIKDEKWVLGYDGSAACNNVLPAFECGKVYGVRVLASGSPVFRRWAKVLEHEIFTEPICCSDSDCTTGCIDNKVNPIRVVKELAYKINNHVELKQIGIKARYITNTYIAPTPNMNVYQVSVTDAGDEQALAAVKLGVGTPSGANVIRKTRIGLVSTYEVCAVSLPAAFQPGNSIAFAVCGTCPVGYTTVAAQSIYIVVRPLAGSEDLTTPALQDTYANTVGTDYAATDANSTFVSSNGATATVRIATVAGATLTAVKADTVVFGRTVEAQCTIAAPAPVVWTATGTAYRGERTMCITLERKDCAGGNKLAEIQAFYANNALVKPASVVLITGDNCRDTYNLVQFSDGCAIDGCLSSDTLVFSDISGYEGQSLTEVVPAAAAYDATVKVGLEITATIPERYLSDCSFEIQDFYETEPIRLEVSWIVDSYTGFPANCDMGKLPAARRVQAGGVARQSGEWLLREYLKFAGAYEPFAMDSNTPRIREITDSNKRKQVDRTAFYKVYYLQFNVYRKAYNFGQHPETVEAMIAFKEGDQKMFDFENAFLGPLSKFGVTLKERK